MNKWEILIVLLTDNILFIGLASVSKQTNGNAVALIEKAKWFNINANQRQRKEILIPIVQAKDPNKKLISLIHATDPDGSKRAYAKELRQKRIMQLQLERNI